MKKIYFWLIAIAIVAGYFGLSCVMFPKVTIYPDKFPSLLYSVVNVVEVIILSVIFLLLVVKTGKGSFKILWNDEAFDLWGMVLIAVLIFSFTMLIFSLLPMKELSFDYVIFLLVIPCNFLFGMFVSYRMFRWWKKINASKQKEEVPSIKTQAEKKLIQPVAKTIPAVKADESKKYTGEGKILFVYDQGRDHPVYQELIQLPFSKVQQCTSKTIPSDLSRFGVVVIHFTKDFKIPKSLSDLPMVLIVSSNKKRTSPVPSETTTRKVYDLVARRQPLSLNQLVEKLIGLRK